MCWALCLMMLIESVDLDVSDVSKRKQRAAEKKKTTSSDSPLPQCEDVKSKEWLEKQTEASFKRIWEENKWVKEAFDDALQFAEQNTPRDPTLLVKEQCADDTKSTPLLGAFVENVLPALKNRGWQERLDDEKITWISSTKREVSIFNLIYAIISFMMNFPLTHLFTVQLC